MLPVSEGNHLGGVRFTDQDSGGINLHWKTTCLLVVETSGTQLNILTYSLLSNLNVCLAWRQKF